jgi:hypothetical protein
MSLVKLPNGKATIDPTRVAGAGYTFDRNVGLVLKIVFKDSKEKELVVRCDTDAEAQEQVDFITNEANRKNAAAVIGNVKSF